MNLRALNDSLSTKLGLLKYKIQLENKTNDNSINILLESVAGRMLNVLFDYNLKNTNLISRNFPGIDLVDEANKIVIQVSSNSAVDKILHTFKQIEKKEINRSYKRILFFFLGDTRKISEISIQKIKKNIPEGINFDIETDIYDLDKIYGELVITQDTNKAFEIIRILDNVLGFVPESKSTGFESISFDFSENNKKAYYIIEAIIKEGINVYISSQNLYNQFNKENHRFKDFLIYADEHVNIQHIRYTILLIDESFIINNNGLTNIKSRLLNTALSNDTKIQILNFESSINYNLIRNASLKSWIPCNSKNYKEKITEILDSFFSENNSLELSHEDIKSELIKIYKNFNATINDHELESGYTFIEFKLKDFPDMSIYYILLSKDYILGKVQDHFNRNYKVQKNRIIVLAPKDPLQKTDRKIENIKRSIATDKVYYIADHLFEKVLRKEKQDPILVINDFVEPIIEYHGQNLNGTDAIVNWVTTSKNCSIAIVTGQGGIGKTTLCKKIHDKLIGQSNNYYVIFINSSQLLSQFIKVDFSNEKEYDIYNLYKTGFGLNGFSDRNILDKSSFKINYQLGNILIIFDGIDELISTIPSFTLELFLKNVSSIEAGIGRGKIIINCRDTYIADIFANKNLLLGLNVDIFNLLPFSKELAIKYFSQHFEAPKKINSCVNMLNDFIDNNDLSTPFIYPPYVVEIVKIFAEKEFEGELGDVTFHSSYLDKNHLNDIIVFKTCNREIVKKETHGFELTVDNQIEFMMEVAHGYNGRLGEDDFAKVLRRIKYYNRIEEIALSLKDHPFIIRKEGSYYFRFDFIKTFFKACLIKSIFDNPESKFLDNNLMDLVSDEMDLFSQITRNLLPKISFQLEKYTSNAKSIIGFILRSEVGNIGQKRKAISNIFLLLIQSAGIEDKIKCKEVIRILFMDSNTSFIKDFCLVGVPRSANLILDFQDLFFTNAYIEDYYNFLNCKFNDSTFFDNFSEINKVGQSLIGNNKISVSIDNFDSEIKGDNSLFKSLSKGQEVLEKVKVDYIVDSIKKFYKCFYDGNVLNNKKYIKDVQKNYNFLDGKLEIDLIVKHLQQNGLVCAESESYRLEKNQLVRISKFIQEGTNSRMINNAINDIKEELKFE